MRITDFKFLLFSANENSDSTSSNLKNWMIQSDEYEK